MLGFFKRPHPASLVLAFGSGMLQGMLVGSLSDGDYSSSSASPIALLMVITMAIGEKGALSYGTGFAFGYLTQRLGYGSTLLQPSRQGPSL